MGATISELIGRVFAELSPVEDKIQAEEAHRAVVQALEIRTSFAKASSTNPILSVTADLSITTHEYDISSEVAQGTPVFVETQSPVDSRWYPVRITTKQRIPEFTVAGVFAAAFWTQESDTPDIAPIQWISFSVIPNQPVRIFYDRDRVQENYASISLLPSHVDDLIVKEAENILIPKIKLRMATDLRRDEEGQRTFGVINDALNGVYQQNLIDIQSLARQWEIWAFRDRDAESGFNKPTPSGRGLYADEHYH